MFPKLLTTTLAVLLLLTFSPLGALSAPTTAPKPRWFETYSHVARRAIVPQSYYEVLHIRRQQYALANPRSIVKDVVCLDRKAHIVAHDEAAASLQICNGSIAGTGRGQYCQDGLKATEAKVGTAVFRLKSVNERQSINVSRERWQMCVQAAREACPTGGLRGVCLGAARWGGSVGFELGNA
ncbi:uncharacterized protein PODANS_1_10560 [Podospora anserina S mat+]|uniref:Podospora anserina S mat+ genomic DNA chromosome 1, supercontig 2 n=1 Tax=Podospora anserina (strain S / ATCC MYA-4624 / DSM 980 / FGSC 10383) TaxID=515849 RepID=B2AYB6_PODAN|nr:uncharacterized protein PODANS_1_10560 [Podospora anserina S mat+]CAP69390.1 unnamed protein product [Podospora anserina S mat+]CDP23412.1 Putative protein of unknown function [Podospora anserina S mat+]